MIQKGKIVYQMLAILTEIGLRGIYRGEREEGEEKERLVQKGQIDLFSGLVGINV